MYASCVRGENPRTVMSRSIRAGSSLMSHLRPEIWDGGDCEPCSGATSRLEGAGDSAALKRARPDHDERDRPYRVSGLVQQPIDYMAHARYIGCGGPSGDQGGPGAEALGSAG